VTVICWRNGVLASDGRVTEENAIFSNRHQKIFRLKSGGLIASAGDAGGEDLVEFLNKLKKPLPSHKQLTSLEFEFTALWIKPDGQVWVLEAARDKETQKYTAGIFDIKDPYIAIGSGAAWAMGAMERGASAEQGVKTAIRFDNNCGGTIQKVKLIDGE